MSFSLSGGLSGLVVVVIFLGVLHLSQPKASADGGELSKMDKMRDLFYMMEEEDSPDPFSEHPPYPKRWFPVKQYRGGLVAV